MTDSEKQTDLDNWWSETYSELIAEIWRPVVDRAILRTFSKVREMTDSEKQTRVKMHPLAERALDVAELLMFPDEVRGRHISSAYRFAGELDGALTEYTDEIERLKELIPSPDIPFGGLFDVRGDKSEFIEPESIVKIRSKLLRAEIEWTEQSNPEGAWKELLGTPGFIRGCVVLTREGVTYKLPEMASDFHDRWRLAMEARR